MNEERLHVLTCHRRTFTRLRPCSGLDVRRYETTTNANYQVVKFPRSPRVIFRHELIINAAMLMQFCKCRLYLRTLHACLHVCRSTHAGRAANAVHSARVNVALTRLY